MERNSNKVYINPNFKRTPVMNTWPLEHPCTTNLYTYFAQKIQNDMDREKNLTNANRNIHVNPKFKQVKEEQGSFSTEMERHEKINNVQAYPTHIFESSNSLVSIINKSNANERNNSREDGLYDQYNSSRHKTNILYNQNSTQEAFIEKYPKDVPIVKSRYSIVRKKDIKEVMKEKKLKEDLYLINSKVPISASNHVTCYSNLNNSLLKYQKNNNNENNTSEKVVKVKVSKYKTIPISYLKQNLPTDKDNNYKSTTLLSQSYKNNEKSNRFQFSQSQMFNKNRYKLTRSCTKPIAAIIEANRNPQTEKENSKRNPQTVKKSTWQNQSKIKLLKANFKINNIPCRLFTKYGKCLRRDYGKCEYLHDKKRVSLCRKFLKGICHDSNCLLSHELSANKMPTCYFYLKGMCTKENCPYLHIKLNDKIKICHNFLRGYCENGDKCTFRHVKVNEVKKSKIFNKNTYNKHLQSKSTKFKKGKTKSSNQKKITTPLKIKKNSESQNKEEIDNDCRYYKDMVDNEGICKNIKPTRCKLGALPSFIQL